MSTILEQVRTSNEPSDELMSARHAEMDALRPKVTCCNRANRLIRLGIDGKWMLREVPFDAALDGSAVYFCPCCGAKLPEVRLKAVQSPVLCVCTDGGYYCATCSERLSNCWCDPMESAWEVVGPGMFYIQDSRSYVGNDVLWWRPGSGGYTCQIDEAGLYDEKFCREIRDSDKIWRWEDIYQLATRVVDAQRMSKIEPVTLDPLWASKRPDLVPLWRVAETGKGSAEVPECVARHMLSYRNWKPGDMATVRHGGIVTCARINGWSCAPEVMLDCIEKAAASG